jgi:multiple sugar transport system ATP-binding protein
MARVLIKNLEKTYPNGFKAVHGNTLEIKDGEFMVFVGPSGCAKSTTLRMIAGLEEITGGECYIGEKLVNDVTPKERNIAMVFQNYALYPHMSSYDNMAFGIKLAKYPKAEIEKRVAEAAEILGITDLLKKKPKTLSGGERQRVALGRAIVRKPDVFLFDEPLSNLDAKLRVHMRVEITKLHQKLKTTMIYVTHDQIEAMTMGDRICVMEKGRIKQVDTPINLYNNPANKFVGGFIGSPSMNMIEATLVKENDRIYVENSHFKLLLPKEKADKAQEYIGKNILFGIRPEHIHIKTPQTEQTIDIVKIEVSVVEQMGNEVVVYFNHDKTQFVSRQRAGLNVKPGEKCELWYDMSKCQLFDLTTDDSILFVKTDTGS